jgi:hypothetical protein
MAFRPWLRRGWGATAMTILAAAALAGAACGAPRYHYVKSSTERTYVQVPRDWTLYDEDELVTGLEESDEAKDQYKRLTWSVAFDAAPRPSLDHILSVTEHPTGLVQVRTLLPEERDQFSLSTLRAILLDFDPREGGQQSDVEVVASRDIERPGGLHGNELLINVRTPVGKLLKWRQIALVDGSVRKVHVLAISCDADCYADNEKVINQIMSSWKVKEN